MLKKDKSLQIFLLISMLINISMNLAHPVTPTFIKNLNLENYMLLMNVFVLWIINQMACPVTYICNIETVLIVLLKQGNFI